jgi:serine/threonine-protein kinase
MALFPRKSQSAGKHIEAFSKKERYLRLKDIGAGGLSQVSSHFDTYLNRIVALKELKSGNLSSDIKVQSFINEAKLTSYLNHPGVAPVFDAFVGEGGRPCYTMKLHEGEELAQLLKSSDVFAVGPRLPLTRTLDIFSRLAETLAYVHDRGVLHLDIKPENIMVGEYGEVTVVDWGAARLYDRKPFEEYLRRFTDKTELATFEREQANYVLGTPPYMSPEQTNTPRDLLTPGSDIFSAGVVLYEMLAGRRPFRALVAQEVMRQVREDEPEPMEKLNPDVPRRLIQICSKMLEKQPMKRYRSFRQVLDDLNEFRETGQAFAVKTYEPGEVIFNENDTGDYAFTIVSGKVEIIKGSASGGQVLASLGPGEIVGELAILTKSPRTATAKAVEKTTVRIMGAEDVRAETEKLSPWVGTMIKLLSERLIDMDEKLVKLGDTWRKVRGKGKQ